MKLTTLQARIKKLGILGTVRFQVKSTFRHVPISSQGSSSRSFRNETETSETLLILTFLDLPYIDLFVAHALLQFLRNAPRIRREPPSNYRTDNPGQATTFR